MNGTQTLENAQGEPINIGVCYRQHDFEFWNADSLIKMKELPDNSVKCILTDPPYKYLKNQKLEVDFDETIFFNEAKRVLKNDGFIVLFGRGASFYRWNYMLSELGFIFKEEFIWDKGYCTSPLMAISRVHETISIFTKKSGKITKVKVPYLEMKKNNPESVIQDIKRLRSIFTQEKSMKAVLDFCENNLRDKSDGCISINRTDYCDKTQKNRIAESADVKNFDRCVDVVQSMNFGLNEKSIIRTDREYSDTFTKFSVNADKRQTGDRCANVVQSIECGLNEKSIIKEVREHYTAIHPTQKPVRLLERLLALVVPKDKEREDIVVADFFGGSFSTMEAVYNMGMQGIATEIDKEYYDIGKERIEKLPPRQTSLFP